MANDAAAGRPSRSRRLRRKVLPPGIADKRRPLARHQHRATLYVAAGLESGAARGGGRALLSASKWRLSRWHRQPSGTPARSDRDRLVRRHDSACRWRDRSACLAPCAGGAARMMVLPSVRMCGWHAATRICAKGWTDWRCWLSRCCGSPFGGALFAFHGKRGGLIKLFGSTGRAFACSANGWRRATFSGQLPARDGFLDARAAIDVYWKASTWHAHPCPPSGTGGLMLMLTPDSLDPIRNGNSACTGVHHVASFAAVLHGSAHGHNNPNPSDLPLIRTEIGRPSSVMRFSTCTATATSLARRSSLRKRRASPTTCL